MTGQVSPGLRLFADVVEPLRHRFDVEDGRMLSSPGARVAHGFFAFVGRDDRMIVKLPREEGQRLIAAGHAEAVVLGGRSLREWVGLPFPSDEAGEQAWRQAAADALDYVSSLPPRPRR